jgi:site-specific DNA recombinase
MYARVSSEQQAEAHTLASQVAAVRERVAGDGLSVSEAMQFLDEGYRGATLVRPALERLRDVVASGRVDRLYVHSPDRLARKYAYKSCWSMSSDALASRSGSSTGPWDRAQKTTCCCRCKG